ncbi:hypothetical protein SLEP1_g41611 [Rubroshorea leprosula]|uniref:Uncharacterized protein n=1 Tax=Rubroshorea leprosula TaxID=152421 RepID=A0AAV5L762_9ROSI|nr:hypothetical protein SLEP1_g41611 [Rubroshorea leprosula]
MQENLRSSIFRIPSLLKVQNERAYKPHAFSFGPWHFHNQDLMRATKQFKKMLFKGLIQRFRERLNVNVEVDLSLSEQELEGAVSAIRERLKNARSNKKRELQEAIKAVGSKARECYEGGIVVTQEEFHKLLLLDGCFIIELFRKGAGEVSLQESEYTLFSSGMILTIYHDLFLLENQIPWFVLELLFDKTRGPESKMTLVELAITFIHSAFSSDDKHLISNELLNSSSRIVHIIDLTVRYLGSSAKLEREKQQPKQSQSRINWGRCLCSSAKERKKQQPKQSQHLIDYNSIPSATRLREAGVKFKTVAKRNILDVRFDENKGNLEIPSLLIHPATEAIFRNLIGFQICSPWVWWAWVAPSVIINYTVLLDCLVDSTEDVDLLCRSGIFSNWLNNKEAVDLLNRLCSGYQMEKFHYAHLCEEINSYCRKCSRRWRVSFIDNYLTKPWAIVSVIFAAIVLVFTIMQVFYK